MILTPKSLTILEKVRPELKVVILRAAADYPVDVNHRFVVTEGIRLRSRQMELYKAGATKTLNSRHLTGHAVDLAVFVNDKLRWDWPLYANLALVIKDAASKEGVAITWGGDWKTFKDGPHYELDRHKYPK